MSGRNNLMAFCLLAFISQISGVKAAFNGADEVSARCNDTSMLTKIAELNSHPTGFYRYFARNDGVIELHANWYGLRGVMDEIGECLVGFEVLVREGERGRGLGGRRFELRKNLKANNKTGKVFGDKEISYSELAEAADLTKFSPPIDIQIAVRALTNPGLKLEDYQYRPAYAKLRAGQCQDKVVFLGESQPNVKQLSFNTKEETVIVLVEWKPPRCNPSFAESYNLEIWQDGNRDEAIIIPLDKNTTKAEVKLPMEEHREYSVKVVAMESVTGILASSPVADFHTTNCAKLRLTWEVGFTQLEWNGPDVMAKVQVAVRAGLEGEQGERLRSCLTGFSVLVSNEYNKAGEETEVKLTQRTEHFIPSEGATLELRYAVVEVPPGVSNTFRVNALLKSEEGGWLRKVAADDGRRPKQFRAGKNGGCYPGKQPKSRMGEGKPELQVDRVEDPRGRNLYNITVSWDHLSVEDASCLEHFKVKIIAEDLEWGFVRDIEYRRILQDWDYLGPNETSVVLTEDWPDLRPGHVVKATVAPLDMGMMGEAQEGDPVPENKTATFVIT